MVYITGGEISKTLEIIRLQINAYILRTLLKSSPDPRVVFQQTPARDVRQGKLVGLPSVDPGS